MIGRMPGIPGKPAARTHGRGRPSARRETRRLARNVDRTSETRNKTRAKTPATKKRTRVSASHELVAEVRYILDDKLLGSILLRARS
jgi:hypothetical protein